MPILWIQNLLVNSVGEVLGIYNENQTFASGASFSAWKSQTAIYSVDLYRIQPDGILTQQSSRRYRKISISQQREVSLETYVEISENFMQFLLSQLPVSKSENLQKTSPSSGYCVVSVRQNHSI